MVSKGDYVSALASWKDAKGKVDDFLYWHNLGSLYLQLGRYPEARLALERAQLKTLYSLATQEKLTVVEEKLSAQELNDSWTDYANGALAYLGPMKLWLLVLILVLPFVWMFRLQVSKRFMIVTCSLIALPLVFVAWFQFSSASFVALAPQELYDGPSKIFRTGRSLAAGTKVLVREREGWWFVVYPPSAQGWVVKGDARSVGALWGIE